MSERWLAVPGYEGKYEVSDRGEVRAHNFDGRGVVRNLAQRPNTTGYPTVNLFKGGVRWWVSVHRLVLLAFVGPRPSGLMVRHLDGDPSNNHLANLRYGTPQENNLDTLRHGRHREAARTHCHRGHALTEDNVRVATGKRAGVRICRACRREDARRRYALKREAVAS